MAFMRSSAPLSGFDDPSAGRRRAMAITVGVMAMAGLIILLPPHFAIGVVIAGFLAVGGWLGWNKIANQRAIRTPAETTRRVGLPALGVVQRLSPHMLREVSPDQRTPHGYVLERPESQFAAVFRHALNFAGKTANGKRAIIAVTSPFRDEGATTVSLCLARTMAAQGKSVVLVDCDLRKRTLTRSLGLSPRHGVWEAIGAPDVQKLFQLDPDSHVKVLPAGNEGGVFRDLFSKRGFFELIRSLRRVHDCVILDCPAALTSVDARMIVGGADSVVLVVQHGKTPTSAIKSAQRQLNIGGHARPAGIIINKAPKSRDLTEIGVSTRGEW
ncbi:MAG TPA: CpsD/CapB family tyrosine-protein kinase [Caulobacterales bacterium]|nr:CpsD/CapB family tyrosine-protein kinase [Caulobacterales bacterium]